MQRSHFCASIALAALGLAAVHPVQAQTIRASQPIRVAAPQPYTWASAVMGGVEYATGIVWNPKHPELLYSKNDTGSIYRLDRRRRRWVSLMDSIPWNESNLFVPLSIAPDANAPDTIYVAGGGSASGTFSRRPTAAGIGPAPIFLMTSSSIRPTRW